VGGAPKAIPENQREEALAILSLPGKQDVKKCPVLDSPRTVELSLPASRSAYWIFPPLSGIRDKRL
jgi:hypothetical protein